MGACTSDNANAYEGERDSNNQEQLLAYSEESSEEWEYSGEAFQNFLHTYVDEFIQDE